MRGVLTLKIGETVYALAFRIEVLREETVLRMVAGVENLVEYLGAHGGIFQRHLARTMVLVLRWCLHRGVELVA